MDEIKEYEKKEGVPKVNLGHPFLVHKKQENRYFTLNIDWAHLEA